MVRMVSGFGKKKLQYIDTIPYLFCRLGEPGIKEKCLRQFDEADFGEHDKVTRYMMDVGGDLRNMIIGMNEDGSDMPPRLADEVESIGSSILST